MGSVHFNAKTLEPVNGYGRTDRIEDICVLKLAGSAEAWAGPANSNCIGSPAKDFVPVVRPRHDVLNRPDSTVEMDAQFVNVISSSGERGIFGPVRPTVSQDIIRSLRSILSGRRVFDSEHSLNQVLAPQQRPRPGMYVRAFGAVECALWDLRGRILNESVFKLLGVPARTTVRCYASLLGFDPDAEDVEDLALGVRNAGFSGQKWALRDGPNEGEAGLARNVGHVRRLREIVGRKHDLMFDALGRWTSTYAQQFLREIRQYKIAFLEEPVHPDDKAGYRELSRRKLTPVAGGEHLYTHFSAARFLNSGLLDVIQPDVVWCGGLTEALKITRLASGVRVPVLPHGAGLIPALHLALSCSPAVVPLVEYHMTMEPKRQFFLAHKFQPVGGEISPHSIPGLGIAVDLSRARSTVLQNASSAHSGYSNTQARENAATTAS